MDQILLRNNKTYPFKSLRTKDEEILALRRELEDVYKFLDKNNQDLAKQLETILQSYGNRITALEP